MWIFIGIVVVFVLYLIGKQKKSSFDGIIKVKESVQVKSTAIIPGQNKQKSKQNILNVMSIEDIIFNPALLKLLWFIDGPNKNYERRIEAGNTANFEVNGIQFTMSFSTMHMDEPSLLTSSLPVSKPSSMEEVESLSYFPSYDGLTSEQRWIYLTWLRDITQEIDIGYVFIFYYGLERHLFFGEAEDAFNMIIKLRTVHNNSSFQHYSSNALIAASLYHKRPDWLSRFMEQEGVMDNLPVNDFTLLAKRALKIDLYAKDIVALSSLANFTNKRYIQSNYELFCNILENKLNAKFGSPSISLTKFDLLACPMKETTIVANISVESKQRNIQIPSLTQNVELMALVSSILSETHETVKLLLRELRKTNKAPKQLEDRLASNK